MGNEFAGSCCPPDWSIATERPALSIVSDADDALEIFPTASITNILYDQPYNLPKQSLAYFIMETIQEKGISEGVEQFNNLKDSESYSLKENEMNLEVKSCTNKNNDTLKNTERKIY